MKNFEEIKYLVTLNSNIKIGSKTIFKLKKYYKNLKYLWKKDGLLRLEKINLQDKIKNEIKRVVISYDPDKEYEKIKKIGIKIIPYFDQNYPQILKEIPDMPVVLFIKGDLKVLNNLSISVVGSRKYSDYGRRVTWDLVKGLANYKITIISGLALGIDAISHKAALKNNTKTIGVIACGLDNIYPSTHTRLAEEIVSYGGAIISEYPLGTPPYKSNFPLRNRIIAGMSLATIVVEAARKSGTLLTAKAAIDYNREVFAVPGSIYNYTSEGANNLIKYGAKAITSAEDAIKELNLDLKIKQNITKKIIPANKFEKIILENLDYDLPIYVDKLSHNTKLEISKLNATLVIMEMKGMVKNLGANNYVKN